MKRKLVAVTLSLVMCLATVSEAGAAAFTSPDESAAVQTVQTTVENTEQTESDAKQCQSSDTESDAEDIFSSGDETSDVPAQEQTEDVFSAGTDDAVTQPAEIPDVTVDTDTSDAVAVKAEDWVSTENGFKLRKPVKDSQTETEETQSSAAFAGSDNMAEETNASVAMDIVDADVNTVDTDMSDTTDAVLADVTVADGTDAASAATVEEEFFTAADGIVKISTEYKGEIHTGYYLFDENGILVTGQAEVKTDTAAAAQADGEDASDENTAETEQSYFTTAEEAVVYTGCEGEAVTPYASTVGQQVKNTWKWTGTYFQYYDTNGKLETVAQLEAKEKAAGTYTGYFHINGEYYCLDSNGKPRTGEITLTVNGVSNDYYFEPDSTIPGRMFHEGWRRADDSKGERWMYYNQGKTKPKDIGKYYKRGIVATVLGAEKGTATYLIDAKGYILKSTIKKAANGYYYGTDSNGVIYRNALVKFGSYRYYFGSKGRRASWTKRWAKVGNHYYYFGNAAGRVAERHGWQKLVNTSGKYLGWLYFDPNGNHYTNKWSSEGYYFTSTGKLASGLVEINGKGYLFEVSTASEHKGKVYKNTMVRYKKKWYIASSSGSLYKNAWVKYQNNWYYTKNYVVQTNQFAKKDGVNGYLTSTGKYTTGWVIASNAKNLVRYIDPDGNGYVTNTSKWINGVLYYFDRNGYRINDVSSKYPTGPYYLEVQRLNGVMTVYTDRTKTIPIKTIRVSVGVPSTPTPTGEYTLRSSAKWQILMGPSWGQYGTHVVNAGEGGIFIHSVACAQANSYNLPAVEYNKLGQPASHGCIRACVADAKWVYEHCNGSRINIIDGVIQYNDALKGPLGKNPLTPLRGAGNFDPTDPAVK